MTGTPADRAVDRDAWARAAAQHPLAPAARLVAGQLTDRADRDGRVRVTAGELAASCCMSVSQTADALATLGSYELLGRADQALVLVGPGRTPEGR